MKKFVSIGIKSLCAFILLSSTLHASSEFTEEGSQIILAGTKRLSQEEENKIRELRALKAQQAEEENGGKENSPSKQSLKNLIPVNVNSASKQKDGGKGTPEKISHGAYYFTSHEGAIHTAFSVSEFREKIKLNDGTIWSVSFSDRWKLIDWTLSDGIFILPHHSFFSSYDYVLVNQRTGDYVDVNLTELEVLTYDYTYYGNRYWIKDIDYFGNFVTLNDNSIWDISFDDDSILMHWNNGDVVTVGINDGWDSTLRPNILIHFNTLKYVRADCLN